MEVRTLSEKDLAQYERFILSQSGTLLYHSAQFKRFLETLLGCQSEYLVAWDNDAIAGILPLMKTEGKFGVVYNSLPFYGSHGGIIAQNDAAFNALVVEYRQRIAQPNIAAATLVASPFRSANYETLQADVVDRRIGQFVMLPLHGCVEDELLERFDSSARRNVRKARSSGMSVHVDNTAIDFLMHTHQANMQRIGGRSKSDAFFELFPQHFVADKDYAIYVAECGGQRVAALLLFYYNDAVEYYVPAISHDYREQQPLALVVFQAMVESVARGCRVWNWGGTWLSQDGVYKFKKKWGTSEKEYLYYTHIGNDDLCRASPDELMTEYGNFFVIPFSLFDKPVTTSEQPKR